jgi:hypothetical protein
VNLLIVGLNHTIQPREIRSWGDDIERLETAQKEEFGKTLSEIIQKRQVEFVGEEAEHGAESIAAFAAHSLGARYANIDMPADERYRRGIPRDYTNKVRPYSAGQRAEWNREREGYMVETALAGAGEADSILILCGREHTDSIAARFRHAGHTVETYDLNRETWYVEDWLQHVLDNVLDGDS